MSGVYGYPPPPYGGSYGQPGYPPGYGTPTAPPGTVPQDQFSQGYQQGANAAGGAAGTMTNWGNTMTNTAVATYGTMNAVVGTTANVLGTLSNTLTGLFGGFGATSGGTYQQPGYGQYQPGQTYGPAWGADMQQAQMEAYQRAMSATRASQVRSAIDDYADAAAESRQQMQTTVEQANTAIQELQAAVGRLQQQGGVSSPQGQAMLAEIQSLRGRATQSLQQVDLAARAVYINAFKAQVTFWAGSQRHPDVNSSSATADLGRAWAAYNGAPTARLHWYSLSKSPVPNAVTMAGQARASVTQSLQQLDRMLQQSYAQQPTSTTAPTTTTTSSSTFLPR